MAPATPVHAELSPIIMVLAMRIATATRQWDNMSSSIRILVTNGQVRRMEIPMVMLLEMGRLSK